LILSKIDDVGFFNEKNAQNSNSVAALPQTPLQHSLQRSPDSLPRFKAAYFWRNGEVMGRE